MALENLAQAGQLRLRVTGTSMLPAIPPGTDVLIRRTSPDDVVPGDVVLLRAYGGVRLHRLASKIGAGSSSVLITRGDNHTEPDPPVRGTELLGVLERIERRGGKWWRRA